MRPLLALGGVLILGVGAVAAGSVAFLRSLSPRATVEEIVIFEVTPGASLSMVSRALEDADLIRSARSLEWWGRLEGVEGELRAGEYELSASLPAQKILDRITRGAVRTLEVVIPEGLTAREIAGRMEAAGLVNAEEFLAIANDPDSPGRFRLEGNSLEGYLFPETYRLAKGLAAEEVIAVLVEHFQATWKTVEADARREKLSMSEVVTLASIVEKETGKADERPLIAAVFRNRLARKMRLETDPTVIYGIDDFDGNLRRMHLEDANNPYNTYQIPGLPPGPIASPGAGSLQAVVNPAKTDYLFFVSRNDGTHQFSRSYREHVIAVNRYQRKR